MEFFRIILILATTTTAVTAIKCYHCRSHLVEDCYNIPKGQTKHLMECPVNKPHCVFTEVEDPKRLGVPYQERECSHLPECSYHMPRPRCCRCHTDGCNYGNFCNYSSIMKAVNGVIFALVAVAMRM